MIDAASGGSISKKTPEEVHELIEEMTANMYQYPLERSSKKVAGIYKLDSSTTMQAQLEALQQQVASLQQKSNPVVAPICGICGGGHVDYECPGASVNLMSLSLCRYLKLGEPQETGITLQFADRSTKIPEGIMEDVLVKIQDFIYPCDFVVLDIEVDKNLPIILGRPFLATVGAIIDCKQGNLTLRLNNEIICFNIKEAIKQPAIEHDDFFLSIDVIDSCIAEIEEEERIEEAKEGGLIHSDEKEDEDPIRTREVEELEAENKEELEEEIKEKGAQEAPKPELKPLPNNLKYVFLEENDKLVIISSCLTGLEEKMFIEHLELVLNRCEEKKLILNWEKFHFMVIVWTDHAALRYLFAKKDSKSRLIRWILLLQEFDIEIKDKKGAENVVADHLSRLEAENQEEKVSKLFPDELICQVKISKVPWFADIANFVCNKWVSKHFTY
ncbi:hypothetical protein H6P81_006268 [Aristolochia fimbriata]|uniref:Reverse transcriptase RNase H-like domain-containing protein n=1 Tax=Aristolochia fimbriata TaxID=158543 RepID=A0AAV7EY02_ARIFI|nr:hypothetical protein H6P81_006268 [Aristolochia fimbriata]